MEVKIWHRSFRSEKVGGGEDSNFNFSANLSQNMTQIF